jgi:DNA-binding transcriptional ArsR family regulator
MAALGDPLTLRIALLIARHSLAVMDIAAVLDVPQPRISHKLAKLRKYELVASEREGRRVYYRLVEPFATLLFNMEQQLFELRPELVRILRNDIERLGKPG